MGDTFDSNQPTTAAADPNVAHVKRFDDGYRVWNPAIRRYVGDTGGQPFSEERDASFFATVLRARMVDGNGSSRPCAAKGAAGVPADQIGFAIRHLSEGLEVVDGKVAIGWRSEPTHDGPWWALHADGRREQAEVTKDASHVRFMGGNFGPLFFFEVEGIRWCPIVQPEQVVACCGSLRDLAAEAAPASAHEGPDDVAEGA